MLLAFFRFSSFMLGTYLVIQLGVPLSDLMARLSIFVMPIELGVRLVLGFVVFVSMMYFMLTVICAVVCRFERIRPMVFVSGLSVVCAIGSTAINAFSAVIFKIKHKTCEFKNYGLTFLSRTGPDEGTPLNIILIAGTFQGHNSAKKPCTEIRDYLEKHIQHHRVTFYGFEWTGSNSFAERINRSVHLACEVRKLSRRTPGVKSLVIGHSHGGSIASMAAILNARASSTQLVTYVGLGSPLLLPYKVICDLFTDKTEQSPYVQRLVVKLVKHWIQHSKQTFLLPVMLAAFTLTGLLSVQFLFSVSNNLNPIFDMRSPFDSLRSTTILLLLAIAMWANFRKQKRSIQRFIRFGVKFYSHPPQNLTLWRARNDFVSTLVCRIPSHASTTGSAYFEYLQKIYLKGVLFIGQNKLNPANLIKEYGWLTYKIIFKFAMAILPVTIAMKVFSATTFFGGNDWIAWAYQHFPRLILLCVQGLAGGLILFAVFGDVMLKIRAPILSLANAVLRMLPYLSMGMARAQLIGMNPITAMSFMPFVHGKITVKNGKNRVFNFGNESKLDLILHHSEIRRNEKVVEQILILIER